MLPESSDGLLVKVVVLVSILEVVEHRIFELTQYVGCWLCLNALPNIGICSFEGQVCLRVDRAVRIGFCDPEGFRNRHLISG